MGRDGLFVVACAGLLLVIVAASPAGPPDESEGRLRTQLAVQRALQQGRDCLQRGNYQAAVCILENEIARVNGDSDYIAALRDAYRGYIRELLQAGRHDDARLYQGRLQYLDPGARLDLPPTRSPAVVKAPDARVPAPSPQARPSTAGTARGAMPDPFDDSNKAPRDDAAGLARQAADAFGQGHYTDAGRLYEQAHRADPRSVEGFREQWAYCKLYGVVESLNRTSGPVPPELEGEVRKALALARAPKLEAFGKDLLRRIQERPAAAAAASASRPPEVRHTPADGAGWAIAETGSFRVFHRQSREVAEQAARKAEETRSAMSQKWFGDTPLPWTPRCDIFLHATAEDYSRETHAPRWSPGHSRMEMDGDRVSVRRIDLRCDDPHWLDALLPHETTHVVLFGRFGRHVVPRWADEGIAVLAEPRERIELHLRNLPLHQREHTLFPVAQLLQKADWPDARSVGPFYAGSVSMVEYLSEQGAGPKGFTEFVRDGIEHGFEPALRRHYGIEGFTDLQRRWEQHALGAVSTQLSQGHP
jgi:tetratricopeptide (TPR) repeat protein